MTSLHARLALASILLLGLTLSTTAHAEPPRALPPTPLQGPSKTGDSNDSRSDQLFRSGSTKFDGGDYAGACNDFSESLKLGPKLGTLLNLAFCHETVGKPVTAWGEFWHGAAWAVQNNQRDRYDFAMQHVRALEPKLPRVVLQLPADRGITSLELDGEPLPEQGWYLPLYLDPGEHRLAVTAPGKQRTSVAFRVTTAASDQLVYIPRLDDERKATPPAPVPSPPAPDTRRHAFGLIGLGAGVVGVAVGATFGVLAITANDRDPVVKERATVATVGFLAGAALAAAGGWLLWTSKPSTGKGQTAVSATPRPGGGSLSLITSF